MALKFFTSHTGGGSNSVKHFDIRLNSDYIVFRGDENEAASAQLAGSLVLCLTEPLMVNHVTLTLSGIVHMSYWTSSSAAMSGRRTGAKEKTFFEKTWTFFDNGKPKSEMLQSNNYEWPFELVLDGTQPESVEGLKEAYVIYRLKAEISRKRGKDIVVRKPLRIVRTIGATALETSHAMSVENVWPNKIEYSISTPAKAVIFGSFLRIDFKLVPLLKGLVIGNIATQLKEEQEFVVDPEWNASALNNGHTKSERIITYDNYQISPRDEQIIDESAEGFQFSRYLELPKSLNKCLQDCNVKGIKIRHKLKFNVQLYNPDGHVSELRANLPVSLYISPSLPINADNDLVDQSPQAGRAAVENEQANSAPPLYGEHTLDQLYSDMDLSGYRTPGAALSSSVTPFTQSRNISSENLASLNAITNSTDTVSAIALQYRLQNLRTSDPVVPGPVPHDENEQPRSGNLSRRGSYGNPNLDYFSHQGPSGHSSYTRASPHDLSSGHSSHTGSATVSRQHSPSENHPASGSQTPHRSATHFEDLAKVPSYSTAVRTPLPRRSNEHENLPSYGVAITQGTSLPIPMQPPSAHIHNDTRSTSYGDARVSRRNSSTPNGGIPYTDERRSRPLQNRGRA